MKNFALTTLLFFLLAQSGESAVSSSASYKIFGKLRERELVVRASSSFTIGEGFLRSTYFAVLTPALAPVLTSITPSTGVNTGAVSITNLAGANFQSGASVKLSKSGQTDISATNVVVASSSKITCTLDLTGAAVGLWDVAVTNSDGRAGVLPSAFKIESPVFEVIKPVESTKNPFTPSEGPTTLAFSLSKDIDLVTIYIYNIRGERIWQWTGPGKVGNNEVSWDGLTAFKASASTGVYLVHVTAILNGEAKILSKTKIAVVK